MQTLSPVVIVQEEDNSDEFQFPSNGKVNADVTACMSEGKQVDLRFNSLQTGR